MWILVTRRATLLLYSQFWGNLHIVRWNRWSEIYMSHPCDSSLIDICSYKRISEIKLILSPTVQRRSIWITDISDTWTLKTKDRRFLFKTKTKDGGPSFTGKFGVTTQHFMPSSVHQKVVYTLICWGKENYTCSLRACLLVCQNRRRKFRI